MPRRWMYATARQSSATKPGDLALRGPVLLGELLQVQAVDVLHDHERTALVEVQVDDAHQVGMVASGEELALAEQPLTVVGIYGRGPAGELENEFLAQFGMQDPVDVRLSAPAERARAPGSVRSAGPTRRQSG